MSYPKTRDAYNEEDLLIVGELHFTHAKSQVDIAEELSMPRQKVASMIEVIRTSGMVHTVVLGTDGATAPFSRMRSLAERVREKFGLLKCILTNDRESIIHETNQAALRSVVVGKMAQLAAIELENRFESVARPVLTVGYGYTLRRVTDHLRPSNIKRSEGTVVAGRGVRDRAMDRFDANDIVRDISRNFGCAYQCLPAPAVVDKYLFDLLCENPLVKKVLKFVEDSNIALLGLGSLHQQSGEKNRPADILLPANNDEVGQIADDGGIGNIGGAWFAVDGSDLTQHTGETQVIMGVQLKKLRDMVKNGLPVILVTGSDPLRIPSIWSAIHNPENRLANILVSDEVTARVLVGDWQVGNVFLDKMKPIERTILSWLAGDKRMQPYEGVNARGQ